MSMETVIRNVSEIDAQDRQALEHVLGHALDESQQLQIRVVNSHREGGADPRRAQQACNGSHALPDWCNVFDGLSDNEIAEMEKTILQRADLSRPSD